MTNLTITKVDLLEDLCDFGLGNHTMAEAARVSLSYNRSMWTYMIECGLLTETTQEGDIGMRWDIQDANMKVKDVLTKEIAKCL